MNANWFTVDRLKALMLLSRNTLHWQHLHAKGNGFATLRVPHCHPCTPMFSHIQTQQKRSGLSTQDDTITSHAICEMVTLALYRLLLHFTPCNSFNLVIVSGTSLYVSTLGTLRHTKCNVTVWIQNDLQSTNNQTQFVDNLTPVRAMLQSWTYAYTSKS